MQKKILPQLPLREALLLLPRPCRRNHWSLYGEQLNQYTDYLNPSPVNPHKFQQRKEAPGLELFQAHQS
jgi:hypothetical protein